MDGVGKNVPGHECSKCKVLGQERVISVVWPVRKESKVGW